MPDFPFQTEFTINAGANIHGVHQCVSNADASASDPYRDGVSLIHVSEVHQDFSNTNAAVSGVQNDAIYPVPITSGIRGGLAEGPDFYPGVHRNGLKDQEGKSRENRAVSTIFTRPLASSYSSTSLTSPTRGEHSRPAAS